LGSIIYSGVNLRPNLHPSFGLNRYSGALPDPDFSDDTINITIIFDLTNNGFYAIHDVVLNAEIHTTTTDNVSALPEYTKIGSSPIPSQNTFP
jgi:hypothetical protein